MSTLAGVAYPAPMTDRRAEPLAAQPAGDAAAPAPGPRPVSVTAAGIILLMVGVFTALIGLVLLILVVINSNPAALPAYVEAAPEGFAGAAGGIGAGLVAYGAASTVVAVQALRQRPWARGSGIVLAALGVAALVMAVVRPGEATGTTPLVFVPVIAALAYAAAALASEGRWFGGSAPGPGTG